MKKYLILIAAFVMMLCLGANYAWSTFVPILKMKYGFSTAQTQMIFGGYGLMFTLFSLVGGRLQDRIGSRIPALVGGVIFGAGYIMAGYSSGAYLPLQIFIGVFSGMGVGLCYLCPLVCAVKWFPRHKSLVTGFVVAAYAGSAIIVNRVGEYLLARQIDVLTIFKGMGFLFLAVISIMSLFLQNPASAATMSANTPRLKTLSLFQDRNFWGLFIVMFTGSCIGLMVIGNIKPFGLSVNLNAVVAGAAVSVVAVSNLLGRLIWGIIGGLSDGKKVILFSLVATAAVCLVTPFVVRDPLTFQLFAVAAGLNYASCLVLCPAEIAHTYGAERMGAVYSTLLIGNGIAGLVAAPLAGKIYDSAGSYMPAFFIFGVLSFVAIFLFYFLYSPGRQQIMDNHPGPPCRPDGEGDKERGAC